MKEATRDDSRRQGRTLALLRNACGRDTLHPCRKRQRGLSPTTRPASCRWTTFEKARAGDGDLPSGGEIGVALDRAQRSRGDRVSCRRLSRKRARRPGARLHAAWWRRGRSEEHTSEPQSLMLISYAVF